LKLPKNHSISELRKYHDVYNQAIVNNVVRNQLIVSTAKKHIDKNESVLIIVNLIEHGENILSILKEQKIPSAFVQGGTEGNTRLQLKESLNKKEKCIVTTVWKEGVNVPELNVIINGAGGKSEIQTLQVIGRGLRMTPTKKEIILYDIFDPSHRFLIEHFGERLCIYSEQGWL
jgi:superfamily II DNA or RNA helicase